MSNNGTLTLSWGYIYTLHTYELVLALRVLIDNKIIKKWNNLFQYILIKAAN